MILTNRHYQLLFLCFLLRGVYVLKSKKNAFLIAFIFTISSQVKIFSRPTSPIDTTINTFLSVKTAKKVVTAFTFDCSAATVNNAFFATGVTQSGSITIPITGVITGTTNIIVTNANGFTGGLTNTTIGSTQTSVQIPISFNGLSATGTYTLVISSPSSTNSCNITVTVSTCAAYKPTISTNVPTMLCIGDSITLTASTGTKYKWSTGETTSSIIKKNAGTYTVTVTSSGCTGANAQTVTLNTNCEAGLCSGILNSNSLNTTFGKGARTSLPDAVAGATTTHIYSPSGVIIDGQYSIANNASVAGGWAAYTEDHSGDGATGRLMVINADNTPKECFRIPISGLCSNLKYQFSAWIRSISNKPEKPNVTLEIRDATTDTLLAIKGTDNIPFGGWIQYGLTFNTTSSANLYLVLRNNTKGGLNGNDLVIDDIQFAYCGPPTILTMEGGAFNTITGEDIACAATPITIKSAVTPGFITTPQYQWQESTDNGATWKDILGATTSTYSFVASSTFSGKKYKLLVAETGKISNPSCRVTSNIVYFTIASGIGTITPSGSTTFCSGDSVRLTAMSGSTFNWSSGEKTQSITKSTSGTYSVTVVDAAGCVSVASQTVTSNSKPTASIIVTGEENLSSGGRATLKASGGDTYQWNSGQTTAEISVSASGIYTVTVTLANGCSATATRTLSDNNTAPKVNNITENVKGNTPFNGSVSSSVTDTENNINPDGFSTTDLPKHGSISMNPDGSYIYTPTNGFLGVDSVHFQVCDLGGMCTTGTITFIVTINNHPPVLIDATPSVQEDKTISGTLAPNASDPDNDLDVNSFAPVDDPKHGFIILNPNGTYTYTPDPNFNGTDSVKIKVCDLNGACDTATLTFTVIPVNDAPTLTNATPNTEEDTPITSSVVPNAEDVDGNLNPNSFAVTDSPKYGSIIMGQNGTFTYTPQPNFSGVDSLHYKVCDSTNTCTTATLIFTVTPENDPPKLSNATPSVQEDQPITSSVAANASDPDGNLDNKSFTLTDIPLNGIISMKPDGTYTYTPNPNFNGTDSVHYQVCDLGGVCVTATIIFTVNPVNDAPVFSNSTPSTEEDTPIAGTLAPNASDIDGNLNTTSFTPLDNPQNGTISVKPDGSYVYIPNPNFYGIDSAHVRVCDMGGACDTATIIFTVNAVNDAPTVINAMPVLDEDTFITGTLKPNATDVDGNLNPSSFALVDNPLYGIVALKSDGSYTYTPNPNFSGTDSVHFRVCDMSGACTQATIIFKVNPVNDKPNLTNATPSTDEDVTITGTVKPNASDIDDNLNFSSFAVLNLPKHGSIIMNPNGTYTYTPSPDFSGIDSVHYRVCDLGGLCDSATMIIEISSTNDAPILTNATPSVQEDEPVTSTVKPNARDIDDNLDPNSFSITDTPLHGSISMKPDGTYTYTPDPNFSGVDSVHYKVCDLAGSCTSATIVFNVTPVNDTPNLVNATPSVQEDVPLSGNLSPNASDVDGNLNPNSFTTTDNPKNGTIIINPNGTFTYTPKPDFSGIDSVHYKVCDASGVCDTATIIFTVNPVNDPPTLANATASVLEDSAITGTSIQNASDPDNNTDPFGFTLIDFPQNGTITMFTNGTYTYTPFANFNGQDSVHYKVCDTKGACTSATLIFNVLPANDSPKATINASVVAEDLANTFCGFITDIDAGDIFNARLCNTPLGIANPSINNNQLCITYTPSKNYTGVDTICLLVCDKGGLCDSVRLPIIVTPVNDVPNILVTPMSVPSDSTVIQCFAILDPDINDAHTASICGTKNGSARVKVENGNLCITYNVTNPNSQSDTICVVVCDKSGACTQVSIPVEIKECNDQLEPTISCPENVEVSTLGTIVNDPSRFLTKTSIADNCGGVKINFIIPAASDDCSTPSVKQTSGGLSGSIFSKGTSNISFEAVDKSGKSASCSVQITVSSIELIANETAKNLCR